MPFGMDDVDYFVMRVPIDTPPSTPPVPSSQPFQLFGSTTIPAMTVLVLTREDDRRRQRATLAVRNDEGIAVVGASEPTEAQWRPVIRTNIEGGLLTIYERRA